MAGGWDRTTPEGIPRAALAGAFERLVNEFGEMLAPFSDDEMTVRMASIQLASVVETQAKMRLYFGAARTDDDEPAKAARELRVVASSLRKGLETRRGLSLRATVISSIVGMARGVVTPDWAYFNRVLRVFEEAADAAEPMKAIAPDSVLDRLAEVHVELTGKPPPVNSKQTGPYYRLGRKMLEEVGTSASIVEHARKWRAARAR